jgi:hypothetical protein
MSQALCCAKDAVWRRLSGGDAFVVNTTTGAYFVLNRTAAEFVESVADGRSLPEIARLLSERYGRPRPELETDLQCLATELVALGILQPGAA